MPGTHARPANKVTLSGVARTKRSLRKWVLRVRKAHVRRSVLARCPFFSTPIFLFQAGDRASNKLRPRSRKGRGIEYYYTRGVIAQPEMLMAIDSRLLPRSKRPAESLANSPITTARPKPPLVGIEPAIREPTNSLPFYS